jgi:hypothetical protein
MGRLEEQFGQVRYYTVVYFSLITFLSLSIP